jgi:hypothetical protein
MTIEQRLRRLEQCNWHIEASPKRRTVTVAELDQLYDELAYGIPIPDHERDPEDEALLDRMWQELCEDAASDPRLARVLDGLSRPLEHSNFDGAANHEPH